MKTEVFQGILIPFLGTTLGSACVLFMKNRLNQMVQRALTGFAAGVMVAASVWSLLIPAMEQSEPMGKLSFLPAAVGFWLGILFLMLLDRAVPHLHMNSSKAEGPESSLQKQVLLVLAVTLHNLPEGMSIAIPLLHDGSKTVNAIAVAALSGLPTVAGALAGYLVGNQAPAALAAALALAGGAMLYVVFFELLPEAAVQWKSRWAVLATVVGFALGVLLIFGHGHQH